MLPHESAAPAPFSILIIEDEDDHAYLIEHLLLRDMPQARRRRVPGLSDAERVLAEHLPDVILVDLGLPDCGGAGVVERLRISAVDTPIVVLTGNSDLDSAIRALRTGAEDFVLKSELGSVRFGRIISLAVERRRIHRQLEQRQKSLESVVFALGHELSAPPRQIMFLADCARRAGVGGDVEEIIADIHACAERMGKVVVGAKALAGHAIEEARRAAHRATDLIDRSLSNLDPASRARISVSGTALLQVDERLFGILIDNLVGNALKYSAADRRVDISVEDGPAPSLSVTDRGRGMGAGTADRIFLPGVRCVSEADKTPGSGFGLTICRQIVEMHGGRISVDTSPGVGSTFTVHLPPN